MLIWGDTFRKAARCLLGSKDTDANMTCIATAASVNNNSLSVHVEQLEITKWTAREIVISNDATCRANTIFVDQLTQKVMMISTEVADRNAELCKGLDVLTEPRRSELVDGVSALYKTD